MNRIRRLSFIFVILSLLFSLVSCGAMGGSMSSADGGGYTGGAFAPSKESAGASGDSYAPSESEPDGDAPGEDGGDTKLPSGMMTAGAWVDNDNYEMWLDLFAQGAEGSDHGKFYNYTDEDGSWGFNSRNRITVSVTSGSSAVAGATVTARDDSGKAVFAAVTNASGVAYLFTDAASGTVSVTSGDGVAEVAFTLESRELSVDLATSAEKPNVVEIMLVVDVTGSMGDEIRYLKAELADVINRISDSDENTVISLSLLFYRDNGDAKKFDYYDFQNVTSEQGMTAQQSALDSQKALGGGDYPEAVDEALELAVGKQWSTGATTKIIFFVLDAPPHNGEKYAETFVNATNTAAETGIRICPIICSGASGLTEYLMREAAIYTGGTFIYVTDDSGIGDEHHDPDIPNVTVELLGSLMVRVVKGYHTGIFEEPIYWLDDPCLTVSES